MHGSPQLRFETFGPPRARSKRKVPDSTHLFSNLGQMLKQQLLGANAKGNDPKRLDDIDFAPE